MSAAARRPPIEPAQTVQAAVVAWLTSYRASEGLRQEELAERVAFWGLKWTKSTVAAIETGRRLIGLEEALILQLVVGRPLAEAFDGTDAVMIAPREWIAEEDAKGLVRGDVEAFSRIAETHERAREVDEQIANLAAAIGDAERRVAQRITEDSGVGVGPIYVVAASQQLWGRRLTEERDRRVGEGVGSGARGRRAVVTRELTRELIREARGPWWDKVRAAMLRKAAEEYGGGAVGDLATVVSGAVGIAPRPEDVEVTELLSSDRQSDEDIRKASGASSGVTVTGRAKERRATHAKR